MKRTTLPLLAAALTLAACGQKTPSAPPATTNQSTTGNPLSAPADYLGAVGQAQKQAAKVVDTVQVQQAIRQFQAAEDRYPRDLAELVKEGYLPRLPALPSGMRYQYDPASGLVRAVPTQ
jgi:predicted small lipoprotein YifL